MMEKLHSLLQKYFPPDRSDEGRIDQVVDQSVEFQNLRKAILESDTSICESIRKEIARIATQNGISFNECDRKSIVHKRSLGLRFPTSKNVEYGESEYVDLVLAISLLGPVFFLELVISKIQEGVVLEERVSQLSIPLEAYSFISTCLTKNGYSRMISSEYEKVLPDRIFLEIEPRKFTCFNGFFGNSIGDLIY